MRNKWCRLVNGYYWTPIAKCGLTSIRQHVEEVVEDPGYPRIAVIRHPCDRLVSAYFNTDPFRNTDHLKAEGGGFEEFVLEAIDRGDNDDARFRPQFLNLNVPDIQLIDFDNIGPAFLSIGIDLEKLNSSVHDEWQTYYSDELIALVKERYQQDFELYNKVKAEAVNI